MTHNKKTSALVKYVHGHPQAFVLVAVLALVAGALTLIANHQEYGLQANTSDAAWYSPKTNYNSNIFRRASDMGSNAQGGNYRNNSSNAGGDDNSNFGGIDPVGPVRVTVTVNVIDSNGNEEQTGAPLVSSSNSNLRLVGSSQDKRYKFEGNLPIMTQGSISVTFNATHYYNRSFAESQGLQGSCTVPNIQPTYYTTNYYCTINLRVSASEPEVSRWDGSIRVEVWNGETNRRQGGANVTLLTLGRSGNTVAGGAVVFENIEFEKRKSVPVIAHYIDWASGKILSGRTTVSGRFNAPSGYDVRNAVIVMECTSNCGDEPLE